MKRLSSKNYHIIIICAIFLLGIFLRSYHFSDWLHFELDQSRDAKVIDLAIEEGPDNLPLLGPKAAGSFLRLGPIFYYFKYLSALLAGNTPSGMAMIIMVFGILAMPAFYVFVRRYFNIWISTSLLLVFSVSLFLVMYSRFSWNPNPLPLFIIMAFYSLLRCVDPEERRRGPWLLFFSFFMSITIQLHFLAFVSIPFISAVFLLIKRPKIKLTYWLGAIGVLLILNVPVFFNELKTGGENISEFKSVVVGKSSKDNGRGPVARLFRDYTENSANYFLILSGQNTEFEKLEKNIKNGAGCDKDCMSSLPLEATAASLFTLGSIIMMIRLFTVKDHRKKDFLIMVLIWLIASFGLFLFLAFDISPRFWLIVSALPFVYLGFLFELIEKIMPKKIGIIFIIIIVASLVLSNGFKIYERFNGLAQAHLSAVNVSADRILREKHRVTLYQQYLIIDYIIGFHEKNGYPIYLNSEPFYRRSFMYHLDKKGIPREDLRNATRAGRVYKNGNYFLIYPTDSNLVKEMSDYELKYSKIGEKIFGSLTVIQLIPKTGSITDIEQNIETRDKTKSVPGVPERYTWEEIFQDSEDDGQ